MKRRCSLGLGLGLAALLPACSSDFGISVSVSMNPDDWDSRWPIEHIRIEASQGDYRAVGCLYPKTSVPTALAPAASDELACANAAQDLMVHAIDSNLGALSWGLDVGRVVNFRFDNSQPVEVVVQGNFGNRLGVFSAAGSIVPSDEYPQLELELESEKVPFLETAACPVQLDKVSGAVQCTQQGRACLFPADAINRRQTDAVTAIDDFCRVNNRERSTGCAQPELDQYVAVFELFDVPPQNPEVQVEVKLRGHFARCVEGDSESACRRDVACSQPRTEVLTTVRQVPFEAPSPKSAQVQNMQCIPATTTPIDFRIGVEAQGGEVNAGLLAQEPATASDENRCFFDVHDVVFLPP